MLLPIFFILFFTTVAHADLCPEDAIVGFTEDGTAACYLFERFKAQFVTAEYLCRDSHGHLASIGDLFVNDFVAQGGVEAFDIMEVDSFWIGGHNLEDHSIWKWMDSSEFSFENWAKSQQFNSRNRCSSMNLVDGQWVATDCYLSKPYVCQVPTLESTHSFASPTNQTTTVSSGRTSTPTKKPSKPADKHCDEDWSYFKNTKRCYKVVEDPEECYSHQSTAATVHSKHENEFIGELASKLSEKNVKVRLSAIQITNAGQDLVEEHASKVWLRELNIKEKAASVKSSHKKKHSSESSEHDDWTWIDGSTVDYFNWADDQPKNYGGFNCIELNTCLNNNCKKANTKNLWTTTSCLLEPKHGVCSKLAKT
ncbi:Lectin C-type domain protein [Aphelenchoides besseyi]|nr:Lectin C-type domain protein [Aphelenchoides besseyi]KAI6210621.1 Lectin C-type domain protein [Aphelenchoides besseyi]